MKSSPFKYFLYPTDPTIPSSQSVCCPSHLLPSCRIANRDRRATGDAGTQRRSHLPQRSTSSQRRSLAAIFLSARHPRYNRASLPRLETLAMACTLDFRCLDEGLGGQKNKRKRSHPDGSDSMDVEASAELFVDGSSDLGPPAKRPALPSLENPDKPSSIGRPTYDGIIAGKVSGRKWKEPRTQRASAAHISHRGTSLEYRTREKELKRAFRERKEELKEQIRKNKEDKRKRREEREKKKKENVLKSGTKLQKITNPKTLKKIAKSKQRKLLKVIPDDLLSNKK